MQAFFSRLWADKRFRVSCAAVAVICLAAHGYAYANSSFLHDRQYYFGPVIFDSATRSKWMAQFWDCLIYFAYIPWLSGVLVIGMFLVSIYMMVDMLRIRQSWVIWLISGVCITHSTVIFAHLYWPTEILAALPMAAASAWCWSREACPLPLRMVVGAFFMGLSMASYGAYACVGPFLVIMVLLFRLIDGEDWKKILLRGLEYIGTFFLGMVFYYVVLRLFLHVQHLALLDYANESRLTGQFPRITEILEYVGLAYQVALAHFCRDRFLSIITFGGVVLLFREIQQSGKRLAKPANIFLLVFLLTVIPLCVGLIYVLAFGYAHNLMTFGYAMPLILIAVLVDRGFEMPHRPQGVFGWLSFALAGIFSILVIAAVSVMLPESSAIHEIYYPLQAVHLIILIGPVFYLSVPYITTINLKKWDRQGKISLAAQKNTRALVGAISGCLLILMLCITVYKGVLTANLVYVKADQIDISTKSMTTRVMARIESCEGFEGTETVVFYGDASSNPYLYFDDGISQQESALNLADYGQIMADVGYTVSGTFPPILKTNANSALPFSYYYAGIYTPEEEETIAAMPVYPANDSIKKIGNTILIKLSEE